MMVLKLTWCANISTVCYVPIFTWAYYCMCRVKQIQVELPPKDEILAPGIFSKGTPGPRWFDFTSAPDVEGFDSSICDSDITWAGQRAFRMTSRETCLVRV